MDPTTLLAQLKDIHEPAPITWFPLAFGWWLVVLLIIVLVGFLIWRYINRSPIRHQVDEILSLSKSRRPLAIMMLLKACAMHKNSQKNNRLTGADWVNWFGQFCSPISTEWKHWMSVGYLYNAPPPQGWQRHLSNWLRQLQRNRQPFGKMILGAITSLKKKAS